MTPRFLSAVVLAAVVATPSLAADKAIRISYDVSFTGLKVAKANYAADIGTDSYKAGLGFKTAGLAVAFSKAKGDAAAEGSVKNGRLIPKSYTLKTDEGPRSKNVSLGLDGGVKSVSALPVPSENKDRIVVTPAMMAAAIDPMSGTILVTKPETPVDAGLCNRTIPVFDGWNRIDLKLSPKSTGEIAIKGYKGPSVTCAVTYVPIGGHDPNHKSTKFMVENRDIWATLVPAGNGVFVPAVVSIRTANGVVLIAATSVSFSN